MATLGFDIYGTIIDTVGITDALKAYVGEKAFAFSNFWRTKQLEYAFRRGLMQNYKDFSVCTQQALDYTCQYFKALITEEDQGVLMERYRLLPPYPDAEEGLAKLHSSGFRMFAFSMGKTTDVVGLLEHAGLIHFFRDIITLEDARCFKPSPAAYSYFMRMSGSIGSEAWLVSGNPFDVIGAVSAGMLGAWVKRSPDAIFDPWELQATVVAENLSMLNDALLLYGSEASKSPAN